MEGKDSKKGLRIIGREGGMEEWTEGGREEGRW